MWYIVTPILLLLLLLAANCFFLMPYVAYRKAYGAPPKVVLGPDEVDLPEGADYEAHWDDMRKWATETRAMACEEVSIKSFDGLTLRGKYYEYAPGAPVEIMFHGYRGTPERDLSGGVQRCFSVGRSCLMVSQRGCGDSEGKTITFGINERKDCLGWVDFLIDHLGPDVKIILTGMSMGAATVLMAAGEELPPNVVGILADSAYTTPKEIIQKVMGEMGIPIKVGYPVVVWGAKLFGHFDPEEASPLDALSRCKLPVLFVHGEADTYVPCEMGRRNYEACPTRKQLVSVPRAEHGLGCIVGHEQYMTALRSFFPEEMFTKG